MKKIIGLFASIALLTSVFTGCNDLVDNDSSSSNEDGSRAVVSDAARTKKVKIYLASAPSGTWNVWAWNNTGNYDSKAWPGGSYIMTTDRDYPSLLSIEMMVDPTDDFQILFENYAGGGSPQTKDIKIPKEKINIDGKEPTMFFVYGDTTVYYNVNDCTGFKDLAISDVEALTISGTLIGQNIAGFTDDQTKDKSNYTITDVSGNDITSKISTLTTSSYNGTTYVTIKLSEKCSVPYTVKFTFPKTIYYTEDDDEVKAGTKTTSDIKATSMTYTKTAYPKAANIDSMGLIDTSSELGLSISGSNATFKVWAPLASDVKLLLYKNVSSIGSFKAATVAAKASGACDESELEGTPDATEDMTMDSKGVWTNKNTIAAATYKYYKYKITNKGTVYYVADINAKACAPDSIASEIIDISSDTGDENTSPIYTGTNDTSWGTQAGYYNPFGKVKGNNPTTVKKYNDAVIYEMHVRDWSYNSITSGKTEAENGKFETVAADENFINHLKDLGVTHVQILPMFDYAQVNADTAYNWGYNPYHYNVPEGRYVNYSSTPDGANAVRQMRKMISKFHDAGIAVIMDVVYNHTSGSGSGSLYDSTVPEYYYCQDSSGNYLNFSGCGNAMNLDHKMVRKYVIDSLKHWMKDYHINGFRFDLMGVHSKEAMAEIYNELYAIDSNVLVYGEPWTGGGSDSEKSSFYNGNNVTGAGASTGSGYGYGAFDDDFRDAIKGAEFGGFYKGQVQGTYSDEYIADGLMGTVIPKDKRGVAGYSGLTLHYAECHDNYTLYDKLAMSYLNQTTGGIFANLLSQAGTRSVKAMDKLAAAYVILSQGTPFMNGGQEFCRTKNGNDNSYNATDGVNNITLTRKYNFMDVYQTYRGLIALRTDYSAFRDHGTTANAVKLSDGVTKYTVSSSDSTNGKAGDFTIVFNASSSDYTVAAINGYVVDVQNPGVTTGSFFGSGLNDAAVTNAKYSIATSKTDTTVVPAKSFVIIKTN